MNIFLPHERDIKKSVKCLDDLRLNKQALECHQLLEMALCEKQGKLVVGYKNHPVYKFYKNNIAFLAYYGFCCCNEMKFRFNKRGSYFKLFYSTLASHGLVSQDDDDWHIIKIKEPEFQPYYMSGSINDPNCIRTTQDVSRLFRRKLTQKWDADKEKGRPPKWTNRKAPSWYYQWEAHDEN